MKRDLNPYERRYVRTASGIGLAMLAFLVLFYAGTRFLRWISKSVYFHISSVVGYTVFMELLYGAIYLIAFLLPILVLRVCIKKSGYSIRPMRIPFKISPYLPLIIFASVLLIRASAYVNAAWVSIFDFSEYYSVGMTIGKTRLEWYQIFLQFIVGCLIPGFCEELLFRGAILTNCLPFGRTNAILISSILFALMHENAAQVFYTFIAGILFGLVYEKTGSIWNCVILHTFNNFFSLIDDVIYFNFSEHAILKLAIYEGILTLVGMASLVALVLCLYSKKPRFVNGLYQKTFPSDDDFAACPIAPKRALRLFLTPTVVLFTAFTLISIFSF